MAVPPASRRVSRCPCLTTSGLAGARVAYKVNTKGEHVVALIFTGFERK
jgi:hypothetical protein